MEKLSCVEMPVGLYIEDPSHKMPKKHLDDETYASAIEAFVIVCTDAIIINPNKRVVYLATRRIKAAQGWWVIGGRMLAGEMPTESMQRCFKRETSLDILQTRFKLIRTNRCLWKDRQQEPQNIGVDNFIYNFAVELTQNELNAASQALNPDEYESGVGLQEFNLDRLKKENVCLIIIDLYKQLFLNQ